MGKSAPKYTGKLAEKFPAPKKGDDLFSEESKAEWVERLDLLFDHYGIARLTWLEPAGFPPTDYDSWQKLALELASNHVPGLQFEKSVGRPQTWGRPQCTRLYVDVKLLRLDGKSESSACQILAKRELWRSCVRSRSDDARGKTLLRKYKEIEKRGHEVIGLVAEIERRWPGNLAENLRYVSNRFVW